MIKLLLLCLLATLVTMEEIKTPKASTTTQPTSKTTEGTTSKKTQPTSKTTEGTTSKKTQPTSKTTEGISTKKTDTQPTSLTCNCTAGPLCHDGHCSIIASEAFCVTTAENNTLDGFTSGLNRTCQDNSDFCHATITITLNKDIYWRSSTACCNTSNCNSHSLKAPQPSTTTSKWVCPSCFALNASSCKPIDRNCVESENKCINVSGTVKNGTKTTKFVGKGCATDSARSITNDSTLVFGNAVYHFTAITITDAKDGASQTPGSVPFIFFLSGFVGLLQAKFIY